MITPDDLRQRITDLETEGREVALIRVTPNAYPGRLTAVVRAEVGAQAGEQVAIILVYPEDWWTLRAEVPWPSDIMPSAWPGTNPVTAYGVPVEVAV